MALPRCTKADRERERGCSQSVVIDYIVLIEGEQDNDGFASQICPDASAASAAIVPCLVQWVSCTSSAFCRSDLRLACLLVRASFVDTAVTYGRLGANAERAAK